MCGDCEWSVFFTAGRVMEWAETMHSGICCVFSLSKAFLCFLTAALCVICEPLTVMGCFCSFQYGA